MRLLHLVHQYLPDYVGGVELNTQLLAGEQAARGHEVSVFFRRSREGTGTAQWREASGVRVRAAHAGAISPTGRFAATFRDSAMTGLFERVLSEEAPDLVHIQHLMGLPVSLVDRIRKRNIPYVITLHDYWWACANAQLLTNDTEALCDGPHWWINCGRCAIARAGHAELGALAPALAPLFAYRHRELAGVLAGASALAAPTAFTRDLYARLYSNESRDIHIVPNGIPPRPAPAHAPPSPPPLRVAYVGGIARQKGVHVLVEAVQDLEAEQVLLDLYGDDTAFPEYTASLRALAGANVTFRGRVPNEELRDELERSHVLVVPSIWYETAAIVIQEAFAARVPVIASDLGALRERVRHGVDGFSVPPGDPAALRAVLLQLLEEPHLLSDLRAGIRPPVTIAEQAEQIERLYGQILGGGRAIH